MLRALQSMLRYVQPWSPEEQQLLIDLRRLLAVGYLIELQFGKFRIVCDALLHRVDPRILVRSSRHARKNPALHLMRSTRLSILVNGSEVSSRWSPGCRPRRALLRGAVSLLRLIPWRPFAPGRQEIFA
jgi:hypothetical protein